jgi:hypothetical protein
MDARPFLSYIAKAFLALALVAAATSPRSRAAASTAYDFSLGRSSLTIAAVPTYNQAPVRVAIAPALAEFDVNQLTATDNASWLDVAIDRSTLELVLTFRTASLVSATNSATVTVANSVVSKTLQITAAAAPLSVAALLDDPTRSRMYGVQQNGESIGAVVVFDPLTAAPVASISVGNQPADLAINPDGTELAVICSAAPAAIWIIDPATLSVRETIPLSVFNSISNPSSAHVAFGPPGILYYVDAGWGPLLRVLRRSDRTVLQSAGIDGLVAHDTASNAVYGFGDFALSPDLTSLYGWAQYGTSAGWAGSYGARFTIAADGRLTFAEKGVVSYPTIMERDPLDTPVLVANDGESVFIKQLSFTGTDLTAPTGAFTGPIYSISPGAEVVATRTAILERATGNSLVALTPGGTVQAITDDYARLVYFDATARQLRTINLLQSVGPAILGREPSPAEGAVVLSPSRLTWSPLPGVTSYRVYLGTSSTSVDAATPASPLYQGLVNTSTFPVAATLSPGVTYYWRIDAVNGSEVIKGDIHSFTVASIAISTAQIKATTVRGHDGYIVEVGLSAESPQAWTASSPASWVRFESSAGTTPATLRVVLDASALAVGLQRSSITITAAGSPITLPVSLQVEPLAVTRFAPRPGSTKVYALSEDATNSSAKAYLLEIDTLRERISRVVPVGKSATDLAVHLDDERIYVTNWYGGRLLALDLDSLVLVKTFPMTPFEGVGYGRSDAYRISAGGPGRLVVEANDQWIDISLFDTAAGAALDKTSQREGGGAFDSSGRFYYHGDNNISDASLHRFDTTGDTWNELAEIRVSSVSYYGSRTVVMSEDGSRVFWNGSVFTTAPFAEEWTIRSEIIAATADGLVAFSRNLGFDVASRTSVLFLPGTFPFAAYNSTSDKLVGQTGTRLVFHPVGYVQPLPAPTLALQQASGSQMRLAIRSDNLRSKLEIQRRLPGQAAWDSVGGPTLRYESVATITGLTPVTTYEFRARAVGPFSDSDWSQTLTATTLIEAPTLEIPSRISVAPNSPLSLTLPIDLGWSYAFTGLPDGVTFDPATGKLSGTPVRPGYHNFTIAATNAGGTTTLGVDLVVTSAEALAVTARYTGLISGADGIAGCWVLNRSGAQFTCTLRTNIGTCSMGGRFVANGDLLVASADVRLLKGARAFVSIQRDLIADRVTLDLSGYSFSAATLDDTGYASPWHTTRRPYPGASAYTALFAPVGTSDGADESARPEGRGFARITASRNGTLSITGENALGQRFTGSQFVQIDHVAPLFTRSAAGVLWGALGLQSPDRPGPDLEGVLGWAHFENDRSKVYPDGFFRNVRLVGSRFTKMQDFASFTAGSLHLDLDSGDFASATGFAPFTETIIVTPRALKLPKAAASTGSRLTSLSFSRHTGLISGTVDLVAASGPTGSKRTQKVTFRGLAVQDIDGAGTFFGGGYVLVTGLDGRKRSGWMTLIEPGTDYVPEVTEAYYDDTISDPGTFDPNGLGGSSTGSSSISISSGSVSLSINEIEMFPLN